MFLKSKAKILIIHQYIYMSIKAKIENTVTFKTKKGYSLEILTPETMKLLESTENKTLILLNQIIPILHSLYQSKEITKNTL